MPVACPYEKEEGLRREGDFEARVIVAYIQVHKEYR